MLGPQLVQLNLDEFVNDLMLDKVNKITRDESHPLSE